MEQPIKEQVGEATWESWPIGARMVIADAQATIAALQARVKALEQWVQDQSTANLETMRHMDEMQSRAMEAEQQLTQRTAELEAAKGKLDIILRVSRGEPEDELAIDYGGLGWENDPAVLGVYDLIAELKHVKGERNSALELRDMWRAQLDKEQAKLAALTATRQLHTQHDIAQAEANGFL